MRPIRWSGILVLAVILAVATIQQTVVPSAAQAQKTVSYDTPVEGQITDSAVEDAWTLTAPAKDYIGITVVRSGGTLAPGVELRDANGQRMAGADVDYTYAKATLNSFTLPAAGTYTVAVSRYSGKDGKTTGNYKLTVSLLGAGEDNPIVKAQPKAITYDKEAQGEITQARWEESWTFAAPGKDVINITATRKSGTLWPELILLDSSGNAVTRAASSRDGLTATIDHADLPNGGNYTVVVKRYGDQDGQNIGTYSVLVSLDAAGPERPELAKPVGPVTLDGTVSGTLTAAKWMDVYTLDVPAKDHLLFTATRSDGSLAPEIILYGANNQEINHARSDETYAAAKMDAELPGPGKYQIRVQRLDGAGGYTTGKYDLAVAVLGTGEDDPKLKTSAGEVKVGTPATGTLTNAKWQDSYTVTFATADPVTITVKRTSGTLVPTVHLLNANNQEVNNAGPDETYAAATMNQIGISGPGQYNIVIIRDQGVNGQTSGGYELDVTQGKAK